MLGRSEPKTTVRYAVRPDGVTERTSLPVATLEKPTHRTEPPLRGMVNEKTLVLGDSFTAASARYLPAGFSDLTILGYPSIGKHPATALAELTDADVVVVEVVERSMAEGALPFLTDQFIEQARQAMAARPVR
jgi:hypothetical protein